MSYTLSECNFDGSDIDISKPIEDSEAQILMQEFSYLGINMRSYYYYYKEPNVVFSKRHNFNCFGFSIII
ncbi:MAG: hypothetical protein J5580_03640 [Clostridia bacterium]|nr:hypothetical protein [Clostridia bacterium]